MSRRYGRNQKRKAREEIARLQQDLVSTNQSIVHLSRVQSEYLSWEDRLNRVIPKYSALRKSAPTMRADDLGDVFDIFDEPFSLAQVTQYGHSCASVEIQRLRMNVMRVKSSPDHFARGMRILLRVGNKAVGYAVDDATMAVKDFSDQEHSWLADSIAKDMINHLEKC